MKKKLIVGLVAVNVLFLGMAGGASATGFGFSNTFDSLSMTVDGIALNITAYTIENDGNGTITGMTNLSGDTGVYLSSSGNLGVLSNTTGDSTYLDGGNISTDLDEGLLFSYDQRVSLDYINFDKFKRTESDDFNLTVDGVRILWDWNADDTSSHVTNVSGQFDEYNFTGIYGKEFLIWADGSTDSFKIDSMEVRAAPVPEPASMLLLGSGIVGLLGSRFRRKKEA